MSFVSERGISKVLRVRICKKERIGLTAQRDIVKMLWKPDGLDFSTDVVVFNLMMEVRYGRVCDVISSKDLNCLLDQIRLV